MGEHFTLPSMGSSVDSLVVGSLVFGIAQVPSLVAILETKIDSKMSVFPGRLMVFGKGELRFSGTATTGKTCKTRIFRRSARFPSIREVFLEV